MDERCSRAVKEVFVNLYEKGLIYRGDRIVNWCPECKTALAEAEIEYAEDPCHSIYVKFNVTDDKGVFSNMGIDPSKVKFVIWTTTTWTLPANVAICVGPRFEYSIIKTGEHLLARAFCHEIDHLDGHVYTELVEGPLYDVAEAPEEE